jgi:hypothetical protein
MKNKKLVKFEELAERRVDEAVKKISIIGNLSNRGNYEYTDEHVKQIVATLRKEVNTRQSRFDNKGRSEKQGFKIKI